ncbi:uncharacterized protein [Hetaerina americana]|uniref:uncharacterized protein isoform X2 n=1 Tax=Hetaerina americana TaxID=62018 RepID=UPI003A7F197A
MYIYVGDGLPEYICTCCHSKLLEFHKFKQTSHEGKTALLSIKMKLEKMNLEARRQMAAEEGIGRSQAQRSFEDDWGNRQLPVESIGQILEVHIKEEPDAVNLDGPQDYSMGEGHKDGDSHHLSEQGIGNRGAIRVAAFASEGNAASCGSDGDKLSVANSKFPSTGIKSRKKCRKCFVPYCKNTTSGNAEKGFVNVPLHRDRRIEWFKAARREISSMPSYELYCCGDHFNLQEDTENYMYHKTMGVSLRIKKDVLPHIFTCQPDREEDCSVPVNPSTAKDKGYSIFGEAMPSSSAYNT